MHQDEISISTALATRLVDSQFPKLAGRSVRPLSATGTDNVMFRLGDDLLLRFPRRPSATLLLKREWEWLPHMHDLPLTTPTPLELGEPGAGYPCPWMILRWIPGDPARMSPLSQSTEAVDALAEFVMALRALPGSGGPIAGSANHNRGVPLGALHDVVQRAAPDLARDYAVDDLLSLWDTARSAPNWSGAPIWVHGDLSEGNLLTLNDRLSAVIDFGLMARGDPAVDLAPAWSIFEGPTRARYLQRVGLDDATVARGRGWALYQAIVNLSYYGDRHAQLSRQSHRVIEALFAE